MTRTGGGVGDWRRSERGRSKRTGRVRKTSVTGIETRRLCETGRSRLTRRTDLATAIATRSGIENETSIEIATALTVLRLGVESHPMRTSLPRLEPVLQVALRIVTWDSRTMASAAPVAMPISAGSENGTAETTRDIVTKSTGIETGIGIGIGT